MQWLKVFGVTAIVLALGLAAVDTGNAALDADGVRLANIEGVPAGYLGKPCEKRPGTCPDFCLNGGDRTGKYDCDKCGTEVQEGFDCKTAKRYD